MHKHLEKMCGLKHKLIDAVECEMAKGLENVDTKELGEVIDMIKDIAEIEEKCVKAAYYDALIAEDGEPEESRMGYNPRRYASGRYAPKGSGQYGYTDYTIRRTEGTDENNRMGNRMMPMPRMGYPMMDWDTRGVHANQSGQSNRYGYPYNEYRNAKRSYTQTHSESDRKKMDEHANEHMVDTIATMRDIWENADPEHKTRMRQDLQNLLNEMSV